MAPKAIQDITSGSEHINGYKITEVKLRLS